MENTTATNETIWVADDGSWGTNPIRSIETSKWSEADWAEFEEASDYDKWDVVEYLARKYSLTVTTFTL
jgi:hypothetical protein